jgi:3'-phosphoadenosine 5'-phosphosulfate sulfotransferase (PAPS reductase)/FAD synthetase
MSNIKHIVCYSGGHSSAIVAIEVVRKFGKEDVVLLNHDINSNVEDADVKRFKTEVADYLGLSITYANIEGIEDPDLLPDQFDVVVKASAFKVGSGTELCTSRLKTEPFMKWLKANVQGKLAIIYYGFDANEPRRIQRRAQILGAQGYKADFPIATWVDRTISQTIEVGINPPMQYGTFKHANCIGCLKAGKQHWYIVYCNRPDVWEKAKWAEEEIGYTILKESSLIQLEPIFKLMKESGVSTTEHTLGVTFWAAVRKLGIKTKPDDANKPCECVL